MIDILDQIFTEYNFEDGMFKINENTFTKTKNSESYIISKFDKEEFLDFFESEKIDLIIKKFEIWQKKNPEIKKNTSLIILLEGEMEEFDEYKNQILKIEEDEFFFRKYVINYTNGSYAKISKGPNLIGELTKMIAEEKRFKGFERNFLSDPEYYLCMQLFVKLPFLALERKQENLKGLDKEIEENLNMNNIAEIQNYYEIFSQKFPEELPDNNDKFAVAFLSESESNELVDSFFKIFGGATE